MLTLTRPNRPLRERSGSLARLMTVFALSGAVVATVVTLAPQSAHAQLAQNGVVLPNTFADLVERVKPSVVSIRVSSGGRPAVASDRGSGREGRGTTPFPDLPDDHPLNEFFRNLPGRGQPGGQAPRTPRRASQGSGFVISEDGFVVTNNHVIDNAEEIKVTFDGREEFTAELVGKDSRTDLALLKIQSDQKFQPVKFASDLGRVGDWVVAVGNPFGLGGTVTVGVLSALNRDIGSGPYDFIQVDAAVNRGNSGGPTFNLKGEVIGVNTAIYSPSGGNVGIAFAVPATTAMRVIEELKSSGEVRRGWLGVRIQNIDEDIAASLGLEKASGALVTDVTADGPAKVAGLQAGDAILKVDGADIADSRDLARKISEMSPNATVQVEIRRGARDLTVPVKLGTFPGSATVASNEPATPPPSESIVVAALGIEVAPLTQPRGDVTAGVVVKELKPTSDAVEKGVQVGDIIVLANGNPVATPDDLEKAITDAKEMKRPAVLLGVETSNGRRLVAVQFMRAE